MPLVTVDTLIPYGNANDILVTAAKGMPVVSFAADPHGGPECLWFCFRVRKNTDDAGSGEKVKLVLKHFHTMLGAGTHENIRPVIKHEGREWERLEQGTAEISPDGRCSISWIIRIDFSYTDVALCYPYGQENIDELLRETDGCWQADTIGLSQGARPLVRLSNSYGEINSDRPGIFLIARQHSGETPGSWVLDGFLRRIASIRDNVPLVWVVPLANIDGVVQGDYGKDNFPYDLNRAWGEPPMRHEALVITKDMKRWKERCAPGLALDFHAPGVSENDGLYGFLPDPEKYPAQNKGSEIWAYRMKESLTPKYASKDFGRIATYASRWKTPDFGSYCSTAFSIPAVCIETPYAMIAESVLSVEDYRQAGKRIADAIIQAFERRTEGSRNR